ncbi:MAG TPA: transketolase C-terminal domain-containing protein, partial [Candidatus Ozemobacteraceae bacterium]|nr:transketolase C-terminal domain-containing protein [Candidatus Ozemobacteraceae bacterium]
PFPTQKLAALVEASKGRVLVLEEHSPFGGLGEATASALAGKIREFHHVAVDKVPRSGSPEEMLESFGLSAKTIATRIKSLL